MLLVPIGDVNEEGQAHTSFVNTGLLLTCFLIFGYQMYLMSQGEEQLEAFIKVWVYDPANELGPDFLALSKLDRIGALIGELFNLTKGTFVKMAAAALFHGGLLHLVPNMLVLWMLGDNVEYVMGHVRYFIFVLLTAVLATCGQLVLATEGNFQGIIGASGFIFGIAAAYLVYFPQAKINMFYWFILFWGVKPVSARLLIGLYFLSQLSTSLSDFGSDYGKVAVWAHVWGFVWGLLLCFWFRKGLDDKHAFYQPQPAVKPYSKTPWGTTSGRDGGWGKPDPVVWGNNQPPEQNQQQKPREKSPSKFSKKGAEKPSSSGPWDKRPNS